MISWTKRRGAMHTSGVACLCGLMSLTVPAHAQDAAGAAPASTAPASTDPASEAHEALERAKRQAASITESDPARALSLYQAVDDAQGTSLSEGDRQELRSLMLELEYKTGRLTFTQLPPGTQVFVDGQRVGTTPLPRALRVKPGLRKLKLFKPGFETNELTVEARAGGESVIDRELKPESTMGEVAIQVSVPRGYTLQPGEALTIVIDGTPVGTAPLRHSLSEGQHRIVVRGQRFEAPERTISVVRGRVMDVNLAVEPRLAHLQIDARTGTIHINGRMVAEKLFSGNVPPGHYRIVVERPGFDPFTTEIDLHPGEQMNVPIPIASRDSTAPALEERTDIDDDTSKTGLYFDVFGIGMFALKSTHEWKDNCPEITDPISGDPLDLSCDTRIPIGGAIGARLGLNLGGVFGLEGFAIGAGDWSRASIKGWSVPGIPSYLRDMQIGRVGGVLGGGIRLSTPSSGVRLSLGAGGGLAFRRVYTNVSSLDGSSTNYAAPVAIGDISIMLGDSLTVGAFAWAEFSRTISVTPDLSSIPGATNANNPLGDLDKVTVFQGTQWFVGPLLSFHFGS